MPELVIKQRRSIEHDRVVRFVLCSTGEYAVETADLPEDGEPETFSPVEGANNSESVWADRDIARAFFEDMFTMGDDELSFNYPDLWEGA